MWPTKALFTLAIIGLVGSGWFLGIMHPVDDYNERLLVIETAPVHVPAGTKPADMHAVMVSAVMSEGTITVPEDGWITNFRQEIRGTDQAAARFTFVYDDSSRDPYCTEGPRPVFVMSVEKTPEVSFAPGYGYFVRRGTELRALVGFANFTEHDTNDVSAQISLSFVPAISGTVLGNAYPLFLNSMCDKYLFAIPPKTDRFVQHLPHPFEIPFDGRITLLGSHGHKNLMEILLTLNGNELWRTSPIHLPDGTNLGNPIYKAPFQGVPVKKGDLLDLTETYTNPGDMPGDAMSSMYIHILPDPQP